MTFRSFAWAALAGASLALASSASAEDADYYRGGWRTDGGEPHVYQFVIKGSEVTGVYCTHCADGTTLAPIEGTFSETDGLTFKIRHLKLDGSPASTDRLQAKLVDGKLVVSGKRGGTGGLNFEHTTIKDPRGPTPGPYQQSILPPNAPPVPILPRAAGPAGPPPAPYVQPAHWRRISANDVVGVWLGFGVGMEKQYFVIRKDGDRLFGLACGRCDNPYTFGALENFKISGDTLEFDIVHQDWGDGTVLPFNRHVKANIAMNEMRMDARRPDQAGPGIVASLVGPISLEATAGNVVGE
ncbi:hypothetical protein [Altererythrobacter sp. Root672]|uniref:hypothetical protein n=1 Tax=Altererythrobacter sp. Root672 TaxID=1736584 RepID=UPI0006F7CCC3|nr:hypothetical protein [Altererythrobacter sp. Root672]KRA84270.1 hypothetical protein ASD76_09895 [Altererythrobacter sp. Root672]